MEGVSEGDGSFGQCEGRDAGRDGSVAVCDHGERASAGESARRWRVASVEDGPGGKSGRGIKWKREKMQRNGPLSG